ncbi:ATP-binding cassette domain-containing protein [Micromonospora sp. NPDC050276]|uniref:ATP-binding cassette domain-containing protein n=1 Tax=Micromonospora sp. NPDC050276 TaxID=3364278 RepID=UPI00378AC4EC
MIRTRKLTRHYRASWRSGATVEAVKGLDMDIEAGELIGFLGPNGAGKTTTLRMLTTLLRPTGGEAVVAGHDLIRDPVGVRRRIGYIAQNSGSSPQSTVGEELGLQGRLYGLNKADAASRAADLMAQMDLTRLAGRITRTLSGGERRRLDVALGLIHSPELVFLDEPTTGLDPQSRASLWQYLRRLHREQGTTLFLTTHYLEEADALADRIIIVDGGRIVADGTPEALKAQVSGDSVRVQVADDGVSTAAELIGQLPGVAEVRIEGATLSLRVPCGDDVLPQIIDVLHRGQVSIRSLQVQRPTLDDVFLTLTGRHIGQGQDDHAAVPAPASTGDGRGRVNA